MRSDLQALLLAAMPATVKDLAEDCGYGVVGTRKLLKELRASRLCFVLRWVRGRNGFTPVYMAGCLKDRPKPTARSPRNPPRPPQAKGPFAALFQ